MPGKRFSDKSLRLAAIDYSRNAAYFITICCKNRVKYFGVQDKYGVHLSDIGKITRDNIIDVPRHFPNAFIYRFVVMPDHLHLLIILKNNVGSLHATTPQNVQQKDYCLDKKHINEVQNKSRMSEISPKSGSLSVILRSYKSSVTRLARKIDRSFYWQSGYYDRIIRNRYEFINVQKYIEQNDK